MCSISLGYYVLRLMKWVDNFLTGGVWTLFVHCKYVGEISNGLVIPPEDKDWLYVKTGANSLLDSSNTQGAHIVWPHSFRLINIGQQFLNTLNSYFNIRHWESGASYIWNAPRSHEWTLVWSSCWESDFRLVIWHHDIIFFQKWNADWVRVSGFDKTVESKKVRFDVIPITTFKFLVYSISIALNDWFLALR